MQKMVINGEVVCPRCKLEEQDRALEDEMKAFHKEALQRKDYNILFYESILQDATLLNARLHNYSAREPEEIENKHKVEAALKRLKAGEIFNMLLQGNPGAGKSHLAYSVLYELNEMKVPDRTCLFIDVDAMLRKIRASFKDKDSKYTEEYFVKLMSEAEFLVLDDLGAETGAIDSDKGASNFVHRVLYAVANARQDKATITTTNLKSETLFGMYDSKLVSRLLKQATYVIFKETKDKRLQNLLF
jgi:DNA replication protein DnaC